jgi:uncharacterized RDD family membrane protein YckC
MVVKPTGLLGQYAGFVSRAIGLVTDVLIVIAVIAVINGAIALILELFLDVQVAACPPVDWKFDWSTLLSGALLCHAANWLRVSLSLLINPLYFALFWTLGGQTPGQYLMGVRVVRLDGKRLNFARSLVRWAGLIVSLLPLGLGYFWSLWDDRRQIFADKMARTAVVYAWDARQNEFLLDRFWKQLRRRKRQVQPPASVAPILTKPVRLELVQVVQPTEVAVRGAIRVLQDAVREGVVTIVTSTLMVKDETGALGLVGTSDLASGDESARSEAILASDPRLQHIDAEQLTADVSNGSFVWSIIVEDTYLAAVLTTLTAAKVAAKVFDLDMPAHEPLSLSLHSEATEPGRPIPV